MFDVMLAYEDTDVKVTVPAVPRVGERVLRDNGATAAEFVVSRVQWYWDLTEPTSDLSIWVYLDEARA